MISSFTIASALLLFAAPRVRAANDWSKPCFQGDCSYDVAASSTSVPASLRIWGASNAISDITEAGGWMILGCDANATTQDIRLVCKSSDATAAGCEHINQGGAAGTIVRLPENCGKGSFARVTNSWTPENQTIPAEVASKIETGTKRTLPSVHALSLDGDFSTATSTPHGSVNFAIIGTSAGNGTSPTIPRTPSRRANTRRSILDSVGSVFNGVKSSLSSAAGDVESAAGSAVQAVDNAASSVNNVNFNKQTQLQPVDVNQQFTVANAAVECGDLGTVKLNVNADVKAHADVALGVVAAGTLVPPTVSAFSLTAGLNAELDGTLSFVVGATGSAVDTGEIQLFSVGIPGLDIPGVLSVGPTFTIAGRANVDAEVDVGLSVGINYKLQNAAFAFPQSSAAPSSGSTTPEDSPLSLSVSPNVTASGSLQAHLIPALNFGLSALGGKASATVFFQLDSSATVDLSLSGSAGTIQIAGDSSSSDGGATATATTSDAAASATDAPASTSDADSAASTADAGASTSLTDSDIAATPTDSDIAATPTNSAIASSTDDAADASTTDESADATPTATDDGLDPTATDDGPVATPTSAADPDSSADGDVAAGDDSVDGDVAPGDGSVGGDDNTAADGSSADASDTTDNASADSSTDGADNTATAVIGDGEDTNDSGDDSAAASDPTADGEDTNDSGDDSAAASDPTADADASGSSDDADDSESANNGDNSVDSTEDASNSTQDSTDDADGVEDDDDDTDTDTGNTDGVDDGSSDSSSDDLSFIRRDAGVSGCVDAKLGVEAQAGSKGSFFGLFDTGSKFTIFSKEFELFKQCFGNGAASEERRRSVQRRRPRTSRAMRVAMRSRSVPGPRSTVELSCPEKEAAAPEKVVDTTVSADSIQTLN